MSETRAYLDRLVAFPTISRDPNAALIDYMAESLRAAGGHVRLFPAASPGKANLLASFGPAGDDGILLSGHSDVVPVEGQAWSSDPFTLTARAGRLYGRGAVDMKGFIACAMHAAIRASRQPLARPLHIAISHDEEIGCVGVRAMLAALAAENFRAAGCIIGEPTQMRVATGHKGKIAGCIHCRGQAAHSANPSLGCNAIYLAADMIAVARDLQDWLISHGARDAAYAVPHSTVHIGTINGGTALNIVPAECNLAFEIRLLPGDAPAALLAHLRAAAARLVAAQPPGHAAIEIIEQNQYPGLNTQEQAGIVQLARAAGAGPVFKAGFGAEAGLFDQLTSLPAIICGPGSIDRAHKPDEYITQDELAACDAFLERIVETLI